MVTTVLTLLSSAWFPLDLSAHQDALILAGNLLAGMGAALNSDPQPLDPLAGWGSEHVQDGAVRPHFAFVQVAGLCPAF